MFDTLYQQLNSAQKKAVDIIDGPVLVVAGPGTGKTQLLSMRVANILRTSDVNPRNILCMTFTEEAAENMRRRLSSIIGQDAYDVEIHTFHSFGATVIARFGEYFYQGIGSRPIDELSAHEIFTRIFQKLPHDSPLGLHYEGEFFYLKGAQAAIDNFKSAGLAPDEVRQIATQNIAFTQKITATIVQEMQGFVRMDKTAPARFAAIAAKLPSMSGDANTLPSFIQPLGQVFGVALETALEQVHESGKTTALTQFKNTFLVKNAAGEWQLKDSEASKKLLALADIYEQYLLILRREDLIDFNDMITRVVHAAETFTELKLNLQEQYQYILVDEFQDTSLAQLRLVQALTDNPVLEGRPNILAVGDDDQAIYSFQGAELSNILTFHQLYKDVEIITLTENYRSRQEVLDAAEFVIAPSPERLMRALPDITKDIVAKNTQLPAPHIAHHRFAGEDRQYQWIATHIQAALQAGRSADDIAVIAPKHRSLRRIVPFLQAARIPVSYDKRENILDEPAIAQILTMARLVVALSKNDQALANALLPEVLSYPFWGLSTAEIWQLYLRNHRKRSPWLELASQSGDARIAEVAQFFIALSNLAHTTGTETMIDWLIGFQPFTMPTASGEQLSLEPSQFTSPFKAFYFTDDIHRALQGQATTRGPDFLELLSHLKFLRDRLREFTTKEQSSLQDLLTYTALLDSAHIQLVDTTPHREQTQAVHLYTAHASKGLEFGSVYIIDANHEIWNGGGDVRGKISMPRNVQIERRAGSEEERRRLLYVAMTRAKYSLIITGFDAAKRGNAPLKYLLGVQSVPNGLTLQQHAPTAQSTATITAQLETSWHDRHLAATAQSEFAAMLAPALQNYRLSITHLQRFLNVADGGPQEWFMRHLLRFPQLTTPHMALGIAVHATLDAAQKYLQQQHAPRPIEELLEDFQKALGRCRLPQDQEARELARGRHMLTEYLTARYASFQPQERFEFDLGARHMIIDQVPVTGKIDRITPLSGNDVRVIDFKTGSPAYSWEAPDGHRAISLYHYKQQLTFYRLLLEESAAFGPQTRVTETALEYIKAGPTGELAPLLTFVPSDDDVARLRLLATAAWQHMQDLDFPDTSTYDKSLKGIIAFEEDLLADL